MWIAGAGDENLEALTWGSVAIASSRAVSNVRRLLIYTMHAQITVR